MITNFKLYESINRNIKIGDYVILNNNYTNYSFYGIDIKKTDIGQLKEFDGNYYWFIFKNKEIIVNPKDIEYWSESKEELESLIQTKKYNL